MSPRAVQFTREEILDAAFQLVREKGWDGFSVQAVAAAINGSTMPIYSKFLNVCDLEDAVCLKAFDLLKERLLYEVTGDIWIDQAINYVRFAVEEKHLFRCLWDGRNVELLRKCGRDLEDFISGTLVGYPLFSKLSDSERNLVRFSRTMLAQNLAFWMNKNSNYLEERGLVVEDYIKNASMALYCGFNFQFK
ncbi:MAG TPA: TetR/AcrR family transcriptional regulator [Geobacteraceae bacterium]